MAHITLDDVGFRYPGAAQDALRGLHLEIENGEAHALLGASGAGKTTLLNLLSGLLAPSSEKLLFNGQDDSPSRGRRKWNDKQRTPLSISLRGLEVSRRVGQINANPTLLGPIEPEALQSRGRRGPSSSRVQDQVGRDLGFLTVGLDSHAGNGVSVF